MRRAVCPTFLTLTTVAKSLSMMTSGDDGVTEKIHFILRLLKTQRQRIA